MNVETSQHLRTGKKIRHLLKLLRSMEYPRMLSVMSFRTANFKLVAEILFWLCGKIQLDHQISANINRENERVNFIRKVCQLFIDKFRVFVKPHNLYCADHRAIQELLTLGNLWVLLSSC